MGGVASFPVEMYLQTVLLGLQQLITLVIKYSISYCADQSSNQIRTILLTAAFFFFAPL